MTKKKSDLMPRPRKYDYKVDKPTDFSLRFKLPVWAVNVLEDEIGYKEVSKDVEKFLMELAEKYRKKD